jgi:broad specificity phosphatase PhoE
MVKKGKLEVDLIRHAKTREAREDELVSAVRDFPLVGEGVGQCEALREKLDKEGTGYDEVYCSPILCAKQTANKVFGNYVIDERLSKHSHGDWEDREKGEVYTPKVKKEIELDPYNWHAPNGESQKDVEERMYKFLEELQGQEGKFAAVTHGIPIISLLRKLWNVDSREVQDLDLANTSLTRLYYDGKKWEVAYSGDDAHLSR